MRRIPPETYDRNEQTVYRLRRSLRNAGFWRAAVWVDPDIVRDGSHHTTEGLEGSWMIRAGQRLAALRAVRLLCGNDIWATARR